MVGRIIPQLVLDLENEDLIWVCSLEEELLTVFSINSNSAPILFGFIKGWNMEDCIAMVSNCVNLLDKKCFWGNVALKIDIRKAFDSMS